MYKSQSIRKSQGDKTHLIEYCKQILHSFLAHKQPLKFFINMTIGYFKFVLAVIFKPSTY